MNHYSKDFILKKSKKQEIPLNKIEKDALDFKHLLFSDSAETALNSNKKNYSQCFIIENSEKNDDKTYPGKRSWINNENNKKTYPNQNYNKGNSATKNSNNNNAPSMNWKAKKFTTNEPESKEKEKEKETKIPISEEKTINQNDNNNFDSNKNSQNPSNSNQGQAQNQNNKPEKKTNAMKKKEKKESLHAELEEDFNEMIDEEYYFKGNNAENDLEYTVKSIINNAIEDEENEYLGIETEKKKKKKKKKNRRKSSALSEKEGRESLKPLDPTMVFDPSNIQGKEMNDTMDLLSSTYNQNGDNSMFQQNQSDSNVNNSSSNMNNLANLNEEEMMKMVQNFKPFPQQFGWNVQRLNEMFPIPNSNNNNNSQSDTMQNANNNLENNNNNNNESENNKNIQEDNNINLMNPNNNNNNPFGPFIPPRPEHLMHPHPMFYGGNMANMKMVFPPQPFPGQNIFPPQNIQNIFIEPLQIENIYLFNKRFNIPNDNKVWYIFDRLLNKTSLPLSSDMIIELYNMKMINGEADVRPVDVFQFVEQMPFSFVKLKVINEINWVDNIIDSSLLKFTELFVLSKKIKGEFSEKHINRKFSNRKSSNGSKKNNAISKEYDKLAGNNNNNNANENEEEVFEVVGKKKKNNKNENNNNANNNNSNNVNNNANENEEEVFEVVGKKKKNNKNENNNNANNNNNSNNKRKKSFNNNNANANNNNNKNANNYNNQNQNNNQYNNQNNNNNNKPQNQKASGKKNSRKNQPFISNNNNNKQNLNNLINNKKQNNQNNQIIIEDTLNFNESTINPNKNLEFTNVEEQKDLIKNLENDKNKQGLQNILNEAEEDWEVVDKKKRKQIQKEKEVEKEKAKANQIKMNENLEQMKLKEKKEEFKPDESIDIVEKLKANNPYHQQKENAKKDPLDDLLNSKKFEVVVKKKKKKNEGKKPPGMN